MDRAPTEAAQTPTLESNASEQAAPDEPRLSRPHGGDVDLEALRALRAFHYGVDQDGASDPGVRRRDEAPAQPAYLPALMWRFRDPQRVRAAYPLLLGAATEQQPPLLCSLADALQQRVPDGARVLKDNLARLERHVRQRVAGASEPLAARGVLQRAATQLAAELGLSEANAKQLHGDIDALLDKMPADGQLLEFDADVDLTLLQHIALHRQRARRADFATKIENLASRLRELLLVDQQKAPQSRDAAALQRSMGSAAAGLVDPAAMSDILGAHRGAAVMPPERRARIESVLRRFEAFFQTEQPLLCLFSEDAAVARRMDRVADCESRHSDDVLGAATERFDALASGMADVLAAMRVAQLELHSAEGAYQPAHHDPWLASFDWRSFAAEELCLVPPVVAVTTGERVARGGMSALSRLLRSGRPVKVLTRVQPAHGGEASGDRPGVSGDRPGASGDRPIDGARLELAYLGISHRDAFVWQSSAAMPEHLAQGLGQSLDTPRPALFALAVGTTVSGAASAVGPLMHAAAAIECRAHPLFGFDPAAGQSWARRFALQHNPALRADWSVGEVPCRNAQDGPETLPVAFTFGDFALLDPTASAHFRPVPASCAASDAFMPIANYLTLDDAEAASRIPFVWGVDQAGTMQRLVVSHAIVAACRDRLGFWRTLQELAGIHSEYVDRAVAEARTQIEQAAEQRIARLTQAHTDEVERVRNETAAEAMQKLAESLVGLDPQTLSPQMVGDVGKAAARTTAVTPTAQTDPVPEPVPEPEPEDDGAFDEPWIDSALCTSCNDCLNINSQLFVYNENKQAQISDPRVGTYAQLVQAAVKCPARCIHPGKPLDPGESDLPALIERAKPYN